MNSGAPTVSFLLPARNAARFLDEALASLAAQTDRDFEVVVVDDASMDDTAEVARAWSGRDRRFSVISRECGGIGAALNCAFERARGRLMARMDADDRSRSERLAVQRAWLDARADVAICGSWARTFGREGRHTWRPPLDDDHIRAALLFDAVLIHPTVLMRREALAELGGYRPEASPAEDFDLWTRQAPRHRFGNVSKVLLDYRLHGGQATARRDRGIARASVVRERNLSAWWPDCGAAQRQFHLELCAGLLPVSRANFTRTEEWLATLAGRAPPFGASDRAWRDTIAVRWLEACRHFRGIGLQTMRRYWVSRLRRGEAVGARREARLLLDTIRGREGKA